MGRKKSTQIQAMLVFVNLFSCRFSSNKSRSLNEKTKIYNFNMDKIIKKWKNLRKFGVFLALLHVHYNFIDFVYEYRKGQTKEALVTEDWTELLKSSNHIETNQNVIKISSIGTWRRGRVRVSALRPRAIRKPWTKLTALTLIGTRLIKWVYPKLTGIQLYKGFWFDPVPLQLPKLICSRSANAYINLG